MSRSGWALLYGDDCAVRLLALAERVGDGAVERVLSAKLGTSPFAGRYVRSVLESEQGRRQVRHLLDQLLRGSPVPMIGVAAYYAAGRRIPAGMRLAGRLLVDVGPRERGRHAV